MKRFIRKVVKMLFYAITGVAVALWILSVSYLDCGSFMPTNIAVVCTAWLAFAVWLANQYYNGKDC